MRRAELLGAGSRSDPRTGAGTKRATPPPRGASPPNLAPRWTTRATRSTTRETRTRSPVPRRSTLVAGGRDHSRDHRDAVHAVLELDQRAVTHPSEPDRLGRAALTP